MSIQELFISISVYQWRRATFWNHHHQRAAIVKESKQEAIWWLAWCFIWLLTELPSQGLFLLHPFYQLVVVFIISSRSLIRFIASLWFKSLSQNFRVGIVVSNLKKNVYETLGVLFHTRRSTHSLKQAHSRRQLLSYSYFRGELFPRNW